MKTCWCGSKQFIRFSQDYFECAECGTLNSCASLPIEKLQVVDDNKDFYGKQYWFSHQQSDLNFPDIFQRARNDLSERNLHWLKTLLKYCLPPADILELGCASGSFVGLLKHAGFSATGLELSPWVVQFASDTFQVPVVLGPLENCGLASQSFDVVALMDVLEHLPDPVGTMRRCANLLKPGGKLLIQTPCYQSGVKYAEMLDSKSLFLEQLKADEHLYLFTKESVSRLFAEIGLQNICFEPAIFYQYDMFFLASQSPIIETVKESRVTALQTDSSARLVQALLDGWERNGRLESDRVEHLDQIKILTEMVHTLEQSKLEGWERNGRLESERVEHLDQIKILTEMVHTLEQSKLEGWERNGRLESDRVEHLDQIKILTEMVHTLEQSKLEGWERNGRLESERVEHLDQIKILTEMVHTLEQSKLEGWERNGRLESDRVEHLDQIKILTEMVHTLEQSKLEGWERNGRLESERVEHLDQIKILTEMVHTLEQSKLEGWERNGRLESERVEHLDQIKILTEMVHTLEQSNEEWRTAIEDRLKQIFQLTDMIHQMQSSNSDSMG